MYFPVVAVLAAGTLVGSGLAALAGPCGEEIARFELTLQQLRGNPVAGPTARQSIGAQLGHQPTPASVAATENRADARAKAALARARKFDAQGNHPRRTRALAKAKALYGL